MSSSDLSKPTRLSGSLITDRAALRLTSADIRTAMLARWTGDEYAIMWEVADGTGAAARRYADAVIMSLWPSRGLELHGVEIKVSRSDWKREAADPRKAEAVGKYCDRWWIHTTPGVVQDTSELPPLWGLREFDGKKWTTRKEAERNPSPTPVSRTFMAALLRRADGPMRAALRREAEQAVRDERDKIRETVDRQVAHEVERRTQASTELLKHVTAFETASGLKIHDGWTSGGKELGEAVAAVRALGFGQTYSMIANLRQAAERVVKATDLVAVPGGVGQLPPDETAPADSQSASPAQPTVCPK